MKKRPSRGRMGIHTFHFREEIELIKLSNYPHLTQSPPTLTDLCAAFTFITFTLCTALPSLSAPIYHHCFCLVLCCFQISVTAVLCLLSQCCRRLPLSHRRLPISASLALVLSSKHRRLVLARHRLAHPLPFLPLCS